MMIQVFMLICCVFLPQMKLALKNGKVIVCDSYEVNGQMVEIRRSGQVFSLPLNVVDLDRSEAVGTVEPGATKDKKIERPDKPRKSIEQSTRKPIRITTSDIKSSKKEQPDQGRIYYSKIGNSVIVDVLINGTGPYAFILDTGASSTVIDPDIIKELGIKNESELIPLVGLAGKTVFGKQHKLNEISLAGMIVSNLEIVSYEITSLKRLNVIGLLGQDYLNYFVLEMDSSKQLITLKAHGHPVQASPSMQVGKMNRKIDRWKNSHKNLNSMITELSRIQSTIPYLDGTQKKEISMFLTQTMAELNTIRSDTNQLNQLLSDVGSDTFSSQEKQNVEQFVTCSPVYDRILTSIQVLSKLMRSYINATNPDPSLINRQTEKINNLRREFNQCIN